MAFLFTQNEFSSDFIKFSINFVTKRVLPQPGVPEINKFLWITESLVLYYLYDKLLYFYIYLLYCKFIITLEENLL
jgi:hypothetical protein